MPLLRPLAVLIATLASTLTCAGANAGEGPTSRDFFFFGPFVRCCWPPRRLTEQEAAQARRAQFMRSAGARPIADILRDPDRQGVLRVFFESSDTKYMALATLEFASDGLHVSAAHFGVSDMDTTERRQLSMSLREAGRWNELLVHEGKHYPVRTRNDLAAVLDRHIRVSALESVTSGAGDEKGMIGPVPGPRTTRLLGTYELPHTWMVEVAASGERPFSHSFVFKHPDVLADVRYMKLLLCVATVCDTVKRSLHVPTPVTAGFPEVADGSHVPDATESGPRIGEAPPEPREGQWQSGFARLHFLLGAITGLCVGTSAAWLLLRRRAGRRTA